MTKHVFLEGTNLKYPPTNQRRDHLLEVFGAIRTDGERRRHQKCKGIRQKDEEGKEREAEDDPAAEQKCLWDT